ncbi:helix-turn-helix transcriptional regulator [Agreia sp. PsM10]|uniref:helix-turn-helix transcriptional regulator n=1 Tax=Agreia sp. PsM10 TaxID=3030533 RepID=UPI00263B70A9|nr:helix-turn-helix transcriptional regulator [Agreia sp. PsM10]MDN4641355.1 helix-turn-helix transcriptional regulator [Agreia sp. PsM10]
MSTLAELLGADLSSPSQRLALTLTENDAYLVRDLIDLRIRLNMSQRDVADRLGVTQATISAFERHDNDPKLSTIRRYALAIGAVVAHSVEEDRRGASGFDGWELAGSSVTRGRFGVPRHIRAQANDAVGWQRASVS